VELAAANRNLSWFGRLRAALCEVGRPDLADRLGFRGPDWVYDDHDERVGTLPGGCVPTFMFDATTDEWRIIGRAFILTQQGRHGIACDVDTFVGWAHQCGRVIDAG
jgi:hypothetical protein